MRQKHIPQRTCVGCRQVRSKRTLVRVVRRPDGAVEIDETGKKSGRGAYLCRSAPCWQKALSKGSLSQALKVPLAPEHLENLQMFIKTLPIEPVEEQPSATELL